MTLYNDYSNPLPIGYANDAWQQYFQDQIAAWQEDDEKEEYLIVAVIRMETEIIHTDTHPFCDDISCPCKEDWQRINEHITEPLLAGLLTDSEAIQLYQDRQIA